MTPDETIDVLTAIASYDLRTVGQSDVTAWHAAIGDLPKQLALEAVVIHHKTTTDRIKPAHVAQLSRSIRRDRAEREDAAQRDARENALDSARGFTPPDRQFGGLPIAGADGKPVPGAYAVENALDYQCPQCDAEPGDACENAQNGHSRKIPCLARMQVGKRARTAAEADW